MYFVSCVLHERERERERERDQSSKCNTIACTESGQYFELSFNPILGLIEIF